MQSVEGRRARIDWRIGIGLALVLVYALPVFLPPPPVAYVPATVGTPILERLFPHVPAWWIVGRLLALLAGAALVASTARKSALHLPPSTGVGTVKSRRQFFVYAAFGAALIQVACLPFIRTLPYFVKTLYVLWIVVPAAILALEGITTRIAANPLARQWRRPVLFSAVLVVAWIGLRLAAAWHSPVAADSVDMFRTLGGLVRLATTGADFMTESMGVKEGVGDIEVRGVNAVQLFFSGLPLLRVTGLSPCLWWMQVANVFWLTAAVFTILALCSLLLGRGAALIAAAAFLFSPFLLMIQLIPIPTVCVFLAALLALLPVKFYQNASPAVLALLGAISGLTLSLPSLTCMTGVALVVVAWRLWSGPRVSPFVIATAALSFVAVLTPNIPSRQALDDAYVWYVTKHWPMAIGETALQGQISPTIDDWMTIDPPGLTLISIGTLLSPFAIPRQPLKLWGDTLYEPLSAGLSAIGLLVCLRFALRRDRVSLYMLALLAAALVPGFVSSYDRSSLTRVYGAMIPLSILSAAGLMRSLTWLHSPTLRWWATVGTAATIAVSGLVVFDVINPRILSASTYGIFMRSVDESLLDRVAFLTVEGRSLNADDADENSRHYEPDWLYAHHPYIEDLTRCAPKRPIPIIAVQHPEKLADKDIVFWNPALEQTVEMTERHVCRQWPDAVLYTIYDQAGLSRLFGAQIRGPQWTPDAPLDRWSTRRCGQSGPRG